MPSKVSGLIKQMPRILIGCCCVFVAVSRLSAQLEPPPLNIQEVKKQAEAGNANAQFDLGLHYYRGDGVPKNFAEACKWYLHAAEQNQMYAQNNLGHCYELGQGVSKNLIEACKWYRKAAEQDNALAQINLGHCYELGEGVRKNLAEACRWYRKAAEQNNELGQSRLAFCYAKGQGVSKDYIQAYKWWILAAAQGSSGARTNLPILEKKLTRAQISEGQKLAADFKPTAPVRQTEISRQTDGQFRLHATATGFFITEDGYLITNFHVVNGAKSFRLVTKKGPVSASVIRIDPDHDLALLKAEGTFVALAVAPSDSVKLGDIVATIGFPLVQYEGFSPKFTRGEINALSGARDDRRYFQISTQAQHGNSGGGLVDAQGNVIGVTSASLNQLAILKKSGVLTEPVNYAVKSIFVLKFLQSVWEVSGKLKEPYTDDNKPDDIIDQMENSTVLVLVY